MPSFNEKNTQPQNPTYEMPHPSLITTDNTDETSLWNVYGKNELGYAINTYPKPFLGVNIEESVALQMARKLIGRLVEITSEDEIVNNYLKQLDKTNNFLHTLYAIAKLNSVYGMSMVFISLNNNIISWDIAQVFNTNYNKVNEKLVSVNMRANVSSGGGSGSIYLNKILTLNTIENKYVGDPKLLKELNLVNKKISHNLGFLPAVLFKNYPIKSVYNTAFGDAYPDTINFRGHQTLISENLNTTYFEDIINKTRVYIKLSPKELATLSKQGLVKKFQASGVVILPNANSDGYNNGQLNTWIEVVSGNPKLDIYMNFYKELLALSYKEAGLSTDNESSVVQSATEVQYQNSSDNETILLKRNVLKEYFLELIIKSIIMLNGKYDYYELKDLITIHLKENIGIDRQSILTEQLQLLSANLTTPIRALMVLNSISEEEAKKLYEEILTNESPSENLQEELNNV